jgi:phage shock protein A
MALFDKVKAQAGQMAQKAQEAGKAGQQKLADAQARRKADAMLHDLGLAVYAEQSGRATDATKAEIDRLVGELSAYESENGSLASTEAAEAAPPTESTPPAAPGDDQPLPGGGFTL